MESEIQVVLKRENNKSIFYFSGILDERADLSIIQSSTDKLLYFNLKEVKRINSFGIRVWTDMLNLLTEREIILQDCPIAFIEQVNMIPEFQGKTKIESFYMPFYCSSCKEPHQCVSTLRNAKAPDFTESLSEKYTCPICEKPMEFDDHLQSFFLFLNRQK